ncbi:hypothetical protein Leryth_019752 [Lithospermum erythrorhizon]|nr:hypothetical protein Leryth_019752 [Lithospermum erythrorhizon]
MLSAYAQNGQILKARQVFDEMPERNIASWNAMITAYMKVRKGKLGGARELFDKMEEKNVVTWGCMIDGYMKMGFFNEGFELFRLMRKEGVVRIESTLVTLVLDACGRHGRYREACQIHGLNVCLGFDFDVFLGNAVITMYSRFGCIEEARKVYDAMKRKDVISSNSMISCFVQAEKLEEAYGIFETCPEKDAVTWTTMITGFARKGLMDKCVQLFKTMPGEKDDVAWTALISGFVNNREHEEAIYWFIQMLANAVRPNPLALSNVLSASASIATLNQGLQIHAVVCKLDVEFDVSIQNSLITMYSKCGNVGDAYKIFNSIAIPNIVSINSMIGGFGQNGLAKEAIQLFKKAQTQCDQFNEVTFLSVLSACAYEGLVEEGWNYFRSMKELFNIEPGPDHYACMVDLLGRAGLLDDAMNLIHSMPVKPHSGIWGALLAASRTHLRPDLAKLAAQHISELEPDSAAPYVVLSDIYSFTGKKKDEEQVRMAKNVKGIKKSPGCSWILLSGEGSHANNT